MQERSLLDAVLDSWDRNNRIVVNLLGAIPDDVLDTRVLDDTMSVVRMFAHMHYCRLVFAHENAPEVAVDPPSRDVMRERDPARLATLLNASAGLVREAVKQRIESGRQFDNAYDHPVLFIQHMIWHEGYHHGQIKLALIKAGHRLDDDTAGALSWDHWDLRRASPTA